MSTLNVLQIPVNGFDDNVSYIVYDTETHDAFIVDPAGEIDRVFTEVEQASFNIVGVLITHSHPDHTEGLADTLHRFSVPIYIHENGVSKLSAEGVHGVPEGDILTLGGGGVEVLHTPGHIQDAVCYYIPTDQAVDEVPKLLTGDTLFVEGCGRTNERDVHTLYESLQRLQELPDETKVYPGHDYGPTPVSTIAHEREHNKYLLADDFDAFKRIRLG